MIASRLAGELDRWSQRILGNVAAIERDLDTGAVVVSESARIRVRALPLIS